MLCVWDPSLVVYALILNLLFGIFVDWDLNKPISSSFFDPLINLPRKSGKLNVVIPSPLP